MNQNFSIGAGATTEFVELADFFRVLAATAAMTVTFYYQGREVSRAEGVSVGYAEKFTRGQFDAIKIYSATAQTVQFVTRLGNVVAYDTPPVGNVAITNTGGAFTQAQSTVTNASAQLCAALATRRYLLIQNNDPSGDIYVTLDGTAATTTKGIKIAAGGSLELAGFCPTGIVNAIGSIASNANVVKVEG